MTSADDHPIARVAVDVPLAHLDRLFDYTVPAELAADAVPGSRVRVRFAGRLVDGIVLERVPTSDVDRLAPLQKVVSPEPVLAPEIAELARAVADRYAGTFGDVLRLALPPRHARAEADPPRERLPPPPAPEPGTWERFPTGPAFLTALTGGGAPRAVWHALPGPHWPAEVATAVQAALAGGRGAVVIAPDARDVARLDTALTAAMGEGQHVVLQADLGPAERYRRWLAVRRGTVRCAVGTRGAAFAPVADLGLLVLWDDGDDLHKEPRAPYPHVRDVLALRAHLAHAALLLGGFAPSAECAQLVGSGWAKPLQAHRAAVRAAAPQVLVAGTDEQRARDPAAAGARLPTLAWETARAALRDGAPVLVQVPRTGYQPALACATCRNPARCVTCKGPVGRGTSDDAVPVCRWCGRPATDWRCPVCQHRGLRAAVTGSRRTAEELGRSFTGVPVRTSDGAAPLAHVAAGPALVVATPGAEPVADGGYGAVLLLDGWALLSRPDLRAAEEALRRWCGAAALARPGSDGGRVVVMAEAALPVVQALVRWDPGGFTGRELAERAELGFPPAVRVAAVDGTPDAVAGFLAATELPHGADLLGPVPRGEGERALLRVPRGDGAALARALAAALAGRSARKAADSVRVELDPLDLL